MRNQLMRKELLRLLAARGRRDEQQGVITVAAGVVTAIVLILSSYAVVALTSGNLPRRRRCLAAGSPMPIERAMSAAVMSPVTYTPSKHEASKLWMAELSEPMAFFMPSTSW